MGLIRFLLRRAPTEVTPPPQVFISGLPFVPVLPVPEPIPEPAPPSPAFRSEDLENYFCCIEYRDSGGNVSRRRITMQTINDHNGAVIISAICHERKAFRMFRADRVLGIIRDDGEIIALRDFLRDTFGISLPDATNGELTSLTEARNLRDALRPGLSILIAAARADGQIHINEVDGIQVFAEREIIALNKEGRLTSIPTIETLNHLGVLVKAMTPQASSLVGYFRRVSEWDQKRLERLRRALAEVVSADGIIARQEIDFMAQFDQFLGGDTASRLAIINLAAAAEGFT